MLDGLGLGHLVDPQGVLRRRTEELEVAVRVVACRLQVEVQCGRPELREPTSVGRVHAQVLERRERHAAQPRSAGARAGHRLQHAGHLRLGQHRAVGRGVEHPERRVRHRPRALGGQLRLQLADAVRPQLHVPPLEAAHPLTCFVRERGPVAVLQHDQRLVPKREVDVPRHQGPQRLGRIGCSSVALPSDAQQLLADLDEHLRQHRVLGLEVLVERRPGDPARGAELDDGDPVEAALGEQRRRGVEDLLAPGGHLVRVASKVNER